MVIASRQWPRFPLYTKVNDIPSTFFLKGEDCEFQDTFLLCFVTDLSGENNFLSLHNSITTIVSTSWKAKSIWRNNNKKSHQNHRFDVLEASVWLLLLFFSHWTWRRRLRRRRRQITAVMMNAAGAAWRLIKKIWEMWRFASCRYPHFFLLFFFCFFLASPARRFLMPPPLPLKSGYI